MRDFSWKYFAMTGDVDAYMLYKESVSDSSEEAAVAVELDTTEQDVDSALL
ncbi:YqzL family protein [Paenibacillus lentus]|uniref:YqzL family protein n=1 Tax=Paenibacillus lentus TaxID=1338368 RepID=A0A3Q8SBK5_9BACL|nr:YqzL family protein [Paenibacillus lentus]AZK46844.1 YqzL family protein [Paenibacillus lentus]